MAQPNWPPRVEAILKAAYVTDFVSNLIDITVKNLDKLLAVASSFFIDAHSVPQVIYFKRNDTVR